ncbi:hypothetical protein GP5015_427 [gamma proteobacterium HTCC5015]|nr:hypothetical protein GP5015_427 [gamma proteobacterium HTCC5015]
MNKILSVLVLVLVSGLAVAADFRADMTEAEVEAELIRAMQNGEGSVEQLVKEAIDAGVDVANLVEPAIKYSGSYGAKSMKTLLIQATPDSQRAEIFQKADVAINNAIARENSTLNFWRNRNQTQAQWSREALSRWESALGTNGFTGGGSTAVQTVSESMP